MILYLFFISYLQFFPELSESFSDVFTDNNGTNPLEFLWGLKELIQMLKQIKPLVQYLAYNEPQKLAVIAIQIFLKVLCQQNSIYFFPIYCLFSLKDKDPQWIICQDICIQGPFLSPSRLLSFSTLEFSLPRGAAEVGVHSPCL